MANSATFGNGDFITGKRHDATQRSGCTESKRRHSHCAIAGIVGAGVSISASKDETDAGLLPRSPTVSQSICTPVIAGNCCLQNYPLRLRVQTLPTAMSRRKGRSAIGKCRPSTYCCDKSSSRGNTDRRRPSSTPPIIQSNFRSLHRVFINEMIY